MRFFWQKSKPVYETPIAKIELLAKQILANFESDPDTREFMAGIRQGEASSFFKLGEYVAAKNAEDAYWIYWGGANLGNAPCLWKVMNVNIERLTSKNITSFEHYYNETTDQMKILPATIDLSIVMNESPLLRYFQYINELTKLLDPNLMRSLGKIRGGPERFFEHSNKLYVLIQSDGVGRRSGQAAALYGLLMEKPPDNNQNLVKAHLWYKIAVCAGFELTESDLSRVEGKMNRLQIAEAESLFKAVETSWKDHGLHRSSREKPPLKPLTEIMAITRPAFLVSPDDLFKIPR